MALIVRTFRSRQGREAELVECLRGAASSMVRCLQAKSVLICRQSNEAAQIFWIGDQGGEPDFQRVLLQKDLVRSFEDSLAGSSPPLSLGFLDEFYRFPPPPYQVWNLEAHAQPEDEMETLNGLFELSHVARRDPRAFGMSLYRAIEEPGVFMGFLGLAWGFTPCGLVRNGTGPVRMTEQVERAVVWRPLEVACEVGRFPAGQSVGGGGGASRAPFWMRSGLFSVNGF